MKKLTCLLLAVLLIASLAACTTKKDQETAAKASLVEQQINMFGEITLQSRVAIEKAEKAYNALDLDARELVPNWYDIITAKAAYQKLRIERIEGRVQAAQEEFDATWNTWNLFYTLRDIIKDCHPDEEYIVKDAIAKNEELCFEGTHFINFDNILKADERFKIFEENPDVMICTIDGIQYFALWVTGYEPYTVREDGQSYYVLYFGTGGASTAWGVATKDLMEHLDMYQMEEGVIEGWGPEDKQGIETILYSDDLGSKLCVANWSTGDNYYLQIFIKPVLTEAATPVQPAEN